MAHTLALHYLEKPAADVDRDRLFYAYALIRRGADDYAIDLLHGRRGHPGTHRTAWRTGRQPQQLSAMISAESAAKRAVAGYQPAVAPSDVLHRLPPRGFGLPQPQAPTVVDLQRFRGALSLPGWVAVRNPPRPRVVISFDRAGEPAVLLAADLAAMSVGVDLLDALFRFGLTSPFAAETRLLLAIDMRGDGHQVDILDCLMYEGRELTDHPYAERAVLAAQALDELHAAGTWALSVWEAVGPLSHFVSADASQLPAIEAERYAIRSLEAGLATPNAWLTVDPAS